MSHVSPDDNLSGTKHDANGIIKTLVCVTGSPLFLFVSVSRLDANWQIN
jgi:hypothetical protein